MYRHHTSSKLTSEQERILRSRLNELCDREKLYKGPRLGSEAVILSATDAPFYRAALRVQYDIRNLSWKEIPTNTYYSPTITSTEQVDRWKELPAPTNYVNASHLHDIFDSRCTDPCRTCHGSGRVKCQVCDGSGTVTVSESCSSCSGKGLHYHTDYETVYENINGKIVPRQKQIKKSTSCSKCHGTGKVEVKKTCSVCNGRGRVDCPTCEGTGKLVHFIQLSQKLSDKTIYRYICSSLLSKEELSLFVENESSTDWKTCDSFKIQGDGFSSCPASELPVVGGICSAALGSVENSVSCRPCFGNLVVSECEAIAVEYAIDGKTYHCILYGSGLKLFLVTSPVSEYFDGIRGEIEEDMRSNNISSALEKLETVRASGHSGKGDEEALKEIRERMHLTSHYGLVVGAVLMTLLVFPLLRDYFASYNIVSPWVSLLYKLYSPASDATLRAVAALATVFVLIKNEVVVSMPLWLYERKNGAARFVRGLLWGVVWTVVAVPLILLANYLGLVHLLLLIPLGIILAAVFSIVVLGFLILLAAKLIIMLIR